MKPFKPSTRPSKKHYAIILDGRRVGESWAVSANKAINNYWWVHIKEGNEYTSASIRINDFDAVEL